MRNFEFAALFRLNQIDDSDSNLLCKFIQQSEEYARPDHLIDGLLISNERVLVEPRKKKIYKREADHPDPEQNCSIYIRWHLL